MEQSAATGQGVNGANGFIELLQSIVQLDRAVAYKTGVIGTYDTVFVNFANIPANLAGGVDFENNRLMVSVSGFAAKDANAPCNRVRVETICSVLPREYRLRAKAGTPQQIARYIADHLAKISRELIPHLRGT